MKTLKLYGYVCGEERAAVVEELTLSQLRELQDCGLTGFVGPCICGCDMWEGLHLTKDKIFEIRQYVRSYVPTKLSVLQPSILEGTVSFDVKADSDLTLQAIAGFCRACFVLEDNNIRYIK